MSPLLGFGFVSPWLLWGLGLGAIPIVIHLLHRRRYREREWAAMRFLMEAARKHSRRIRLEQLLLMAVRILILVLAALALAEPYIESFGTLFKTPQPVHRIIVIDGSYSMAWRSGDSSSFERAREMARKVVSTAQSGDALNLVLMSGARSRAVIAEPTYQPGQVLRELSDLKVTDESASAISALETAAGLLLKAPQIKRTEIVFISDFQQVTWHPKAAARRTQIERKMKQLAEHARVMLLDVGQAGMSNTAVTGFTVDEPFVVVGKNVTLNVTVRNNGPAPLASTLLALRIDDVPVTARRIDLPPHTDVHVRFTHRFATAGEHSLEARLQGDALDVDNHRLLSLPVRDQLHVLLVNGGTAGPSEHDAVRYLRTALAPVTKDENRPGAIRPVVIEDGELASADLGRYDCVFLCNVGIFTDREAAILSAYVGSGGGLVFCLGDRVQADSYNRVLYRDGKGLLPARLGNQIGDARQPKTPYTFDASDLSHPIVNVFEGNRNAGLETVLTFAYVKTIVPQEGRTRTVLDFNTGDAAILEQRYGQGRVILLATSVDSSWSTWPINPSFPPLVHELLKFAVAGRWSERQHLVGEVLSRSFPGTAFGMPVRIIRPDKMATPLQPKESDSVITVAYDQTDAAGLYTLVLGPPLSRRELFAVNVDPREADLATVGEQKLKAVVFPHVDFVYRTQWQAFHRETGVSTDAAGTLTRLLLGTVFCLILVEQLMSWRFAYGFLLLYVLVAITFVRQAWTYSLPGGILLTIVLIAGLAALVNLMRVRRRKRPPAGG